MVTTPHDDEWSTRPERGGESLCLAQHLTGVPITIEAGHLAGGITTLSASVTKSGRPTTGHPGVAWSVGLGLLAGWLATGSLGILAVSLQGDLVLVLLGAAVLCARPKFRIGLAGMSSPPSPSVLRSLPAGGGASAVWPDTDCGSGAWVCWPQGWPVSARRLMLIGSLAVLALALYRFAQQSLPAVWMLSDALGSWLGQLAGSRAAQAPGDRRQLRRASTSWSSWVVFCRRLGDAAAGAAACTGDVCRRVDCGGALPVSGGAGIYARDRCVLCRRSPRRVLATPTCLHRSVGP